MIVIDLVRRNPALVSSFVTAVIALLAAFGVPISEDQRAAVVGVVAAVVALLSGAVTRALVTPVYDPRDVDGTPLVRAEDTTEDTTGSA